MLLDTVPILDLIHLTVTDFSTPLSLLTAKFEAYDAEFMIGDCPNAVEQLLYLPFRTPLPVFASYLHKKMRSESGTMYMTRSLQYMKDAAIMSRHKDKSEVVKKLEWVIRYLMGTLITNILIKEAFNEIVFIIDFLKGLEITFHRFEGTFVEKIKGYRNMKILYEHSAFK